MLVITLGVTGLSSVLLFLYFRNRIVQVEEKVDTMFQLIQSYESNRGTQFTMQENSPPQEYYETQDPTYQETYTEEQQTTKENPNNNLIAVSDKNSESESEESDSESDSEESDSEESDIEEPKQLVVTEEEDNVKDR